MPPDSTTAMGMVGAVSGAVPAPAPDTTVAFALLVLLVASWFPLAAAFAAGREGHDPGAVRGLALRTALGMAAWMLVPALLAGSGVLADFDAMPAPLMILMVVLFGAATALAFSSFGSLLAQRLDLALLVGLQGFRLPLEALLHRLYEEGALPVQMTWSGMNFDVLTGITALILAALLTRRRLPAALILAWNMMGLALLTAIVAIAILSTPVPFRAFHNEPANRIVAQLPWVWLPSVCVVVAWFGHLLVFRRLALDDEAADERRAGR